MAMFEKEIIIITILLTAGVFVSGQNSTILGLNTNSTSDADTIRQSDKSEIKVDLAIGRTSLTEAIKIVNANKSGFVRLYPAGRLETLLKDVKEKPLYVQLYATNDTAPLIPTAGTTEAPSTQAPTTKPESESTTSPASEPTTSSESEPSTSPASETTRLQTTDATASTSSEPTASPASEPTASPASETTRLPTTGPTSSTSSTTPKPKPTPVPHHGLTRGEIGALVIFIIILFGVASGALVFYIRRRRMADDSYTQLVR